MIYYLIQFANFAPILAADLTYDEHQQILKIKVKMSMFPGAGYSPEEQALLAEIRSIVAGREISYHDL